MTAIVPVPQIESSHSGHSTLRLSALIVGATTGYEKIINAGLTIAVARLLTPQDVGVVAIIYFWAGLLWQFTEWSLDLALIRMRRIDDRIVATNFWLQALAGAASLFLAASAFVPLSWWNPAVVPAGVLVLSCGRVVGALGQTSRSLLDRELQFSLTATASAIAVTVSAGTGIALAYFGFGPWSLIVGGTAVSAVYPCVCTLVLVRARKLQVGPKLFMIGEARGFLRYATRGWVGGLASTFENQGDNFLVSVMAGATSLGFYDRAFRLASLPATATFFLVSRMSVPLFGGRQSDKCQLSRAFQTMTGVLLRAAFGISIVLYIAADEIVLALLGPQWSRAVPLFRALVLYTLPVPVYFESAALLFALGRPGTVSWLNWLHAVLLLACVAALVPLIGLEGAAYGVVLAASVTALASWLCIRHTVDVAWSRLLAPPILASISAFGLAFALSTVYLARTPLAPSGVLGSVAGLAYIVLLSFLDRHFGFVEFSRPWRWISSSVRPTSV